MHDAFNASNGTAMSSIRSFMPNLYILSAKPDTDQLIIHFLKRNHVLFYLINFKTLKKLCYEKNNLAGCPGRTRDYV